MEIKSPNGSIIYTDTEDHFENGFLRLMSMDRVTFEKWLKLSEKFNEKLLINLDFGWEELHPPNYKNNSKPLENGPNDEKAWLRHPSIIENPNYGIAYSSEFTYDIAWLVKYDGEKYVRVIDPPIYEESYFEGDPLAAGGYGAYTEQAGWRLEKSARQVAELSNITGLTTGRVLDLGSGYGYFRKALQDAGFQHEGVEISKHANAVSKSLYGFDSYQGLLSEHLDKFSESFDVVVLSDVIEHVADPIALLKEIYTVVKPGGFVVIKTPNLDCPEEMLFGPRYHSYKREHLIYFTNDALIAYAAKAGFVSHKSLSVSHLLTGFVGVEKANKWANELNGADLIVYLKKP